MAYLLLIHEPRGQRAARSLAEGQAAYAAMVAWGESLHARGKLIASESLAQDSEGLRLQRRDGALLTTDGPFTESKEMLGGFFLLDTDDRAEAEAIAAECPAVHYATVELRRASPCYA
jgi:hypothetical protein